MGQETTLHLLAQWASIVGPILVILAMYLSNRDTRVKTIVRVDTHEDRLDQIDDGQRRQWDKLDNHEQRISRIEGSGKVNGRAPH